MKVGDLVQVLPAKWGYYIIVEDIDGVNIDGNKLWMLKGCLDANFADGGAMSEKFMEVVSESR